MIHWLHTDHKKRLSLSNVRETLSSEHLLRDAKSKQVNQRGGRRGFGGRKREVALSWYKCREWRSEINHAYQADEDTPGSLIEASVVLSLTDIQAHNLSDDHLNDGSGRASADG